MYLNGKVYIFIHSFDLPRGMAINSEVPDGSLVVRSKMSPATMGELATTKIQNQRPEKSLQFQEVSPLGREEKN